MGGFALTRVGYKYRRLFHTAIPGHGLTKFALVIFLLIKWEILCTGQIVVDFSMHGLAGLFINILKGTVK